MSLRCRLLGHRWRWASEYPIVDTLPQIATFRCARCGELRETEIAWEGPNGTLITPTILAPRLSLN